MRSGLNTPSRKPWSPWKVLLVAVLVCTVCFVLVVGGTIYWFVSIRNAHQARDARQRGEVTEQIQLFPEEVGTTNLPARPRTRSLRTNTIARNAILERAGTNNPHA